MKAVSIKPCNMWFNGPSTVTYTPSMHVGANMQCTLLYQDCSCLLLPTLSASEGAVYLFLFLCFIACFSMTCVYCLTFL